MSEPKVIATVIAILVVIFAVTYIYLNCKNPYVWEIIIGSVAVSLVLGGVSALVQHIWEKGITGTSIVLAMAVFALLTLLIATLVWLSNTPKAIRKEIRVTYLVSPRKKELPYGLRFADTSTTVSYDNARMIFKNFRDKSPDNAKKIQELAKEPGQGDFRFAIEFFRDLTEYIVAYNLGNHFTTPETGLTLYRKETAKWLGFPHEDIAGKPRSFETIPGDFRSNMFYGIKGYPHDKLELRLPKNTKISLDREGALSSQFILKNKFMEIKIGIFFSIGDSQSFGFLSESAFMRHGIDSNELNLAFNRYETIIYYDVTFSKWRYGYGEMKHYEEWANDLFAMLERKFRWGSPALLEEVEVFRRFEQAAKKNKE